MQSSMNIWDIILRAGTSSENSLFDLHVLRFLSHQNIYNPHLIASSQFITWDIQKYLFCKETFCNFKTYFEYIVIITPGFLSYI